MIRYQVRSRSLVDIYNDIKDEKLVLSPHFQRKLVWRDTHKKDFIKTILEGFPFPEVFLSRGRIDVESMSSVSAVVDGQQRLNTIREFIENKFDVNSKYFSDLTLEEKSSFLKYEIAVIDLDIEEDDPEVVEIFKRLNRTFYALSQIERMATEYGAQDLMLVAKYVAGEYYREDSLANVGEGVNSDPNLNDDFLRWANSTDCRDIQRLVLETGVFSSYEVSRQVHLNYVLNLICTLTLGYYARNDGIRELLEPNESPTDWEAYEKLVVALNHYAQWSISNELLHEFWFTKSNAFSLIVEGSSILLQGLSIDPEARERLYEFANDPPPEYKLAAREGVNNLKERSLRGDRIRELLNPSALAPGS